MHHFLFWNYFLTTSDPAIDFGLKIHPICLPVSSNTDPNKWSDKDVDILGFSTLDKGQSINRGDRLKVATMTVYNQTICNSRLDSALEEVTKCKSIQCFFYLSKVSWTVKVLIELKILLKSNILSPHFLCWIFGVVPFNTTYHKLRRKYLLLQAEQLTKWQNWPFCVK